MKIREKITNRLDLCNIDNEKQKKGREYKLESIEDHEK